MPVDLPRLRATLGDTAFTRLRAALRRRLELGRPLTGSLTLSAARTAERHALDTLLGRPPTRGDSLRVDLDVLSETLTLAGICVSLQEAVETLDGPVTMRRDEEHRLLQAWRDVHKDALNVFAPWPALTPWLEELFTIGTLKRLTREPSAGSSLLSEVARLVALLPAHGEPLAGLAARLYGDAHALDAGSPLATLAVRASARFGGLHEFCDDSEGRREAWAAVGILCDELSTPALVFNLPSAGNTPAARLLRTARADGEPVYLSLRYLLLWPLSCDPALAGQDVFICENPTIVALAARKLGARCAPLVCVNGQFATPAKTLLRQLSSAGARLRYHGDFDAGGLTIARRVIAEHGAIPWRMSAADYEAASKGKPLLAESIPACPWDPALSEILRQEARAVHEEAVAEDLLKDLTIGSHDPKFQI
jgi:uncharacterized protein (TIGR02679 family)